MRVPHKQHHRRLLPTSVAALLAGTGAFVACRCGVPPLRRVLVIAATHGNEMTGPWVTQRMLRRPELVERPTLAVTTVIGNPKAYAENRRFMDVDLNRQFKPQDLANMTLCGYEHQRAKVLHNRFREATDFVIDLHTSTASMGITLVCEKWSDISLAAAAWCQGSLQRRCAAGELPPVRVVRETLSRDDCGHAIALNKHGLLVEVGPVPQGVLRHDVCIWMEAATVAVLDFLDAFNQGSVDIPRRAVVYDDQNIKVPLPQGLDGKPLAIFHKDFQDRDFEPLRKGDPIFEELDGKVRHYDGSHGDVIWPVFINEGGYYYRESGLGFGVTLRKELEVPSVTVEAPP